ncbi:MAG: radical SAM protein [Candidatus Omnitrophica bacterium]|nr:radical SAM protein [Candidatus Omnitrophota bacterium]
MYPRYLPLYQNGILRRRAEESYHILESCHLCPRHCQVNRLKKERGFCKSSQNPIVASWNPHFGEEPPISGYRGSGTIFFTNCTLRCCFCQNYPISQLGEGNEETIDSLSRMMLRLQEKGCHNINFVTPTHFVPQILKGLLLAIPEGLKIPLVYNTSGYEALKTLKLLDGIVDIYMPDFKYGDDRGGKIYSEVPDYFSKTKEAMKEMHRQVGNLELDRKGIAKKGLLIRHLILPNGLAKSERVLKFIAREISPDTYISLMAQYFPANRAPQIPELNRRITRGEYRKVLNLANSLGLKNILHQEM